MRGSPKIWIGADPGGAGNFGVAILDPDGLARTFCVNCADEAMAVLREQITDDPIGVGVDAPLWWSSGRSGDRKADQRMRETYGLSGGQVQAMNSLRGAVLVQGVMFVHRLRELYPDIGVTETHPKALLKALNAGSWGAFTRKYSIKTRIQADQEHERDAVISAIAAREGFEGRWSKDLCLARHPCEQDPSRYWLAPVHYFWPGG